MGAILCKFESCPRHTPQTYNKNASNLDEDLERFIFYKKNSSKFRGVFLLYLGIVFLFTNNVAFLNWTSNALMIYRFFNAFGHGKTNINGIGGVAPSVHDKVATVIA